jgi:hypothetical protein
MKEGRKEERGKGEEEKDKRGSAITKMEWGEDGIRYWNKFNCKENRRRRKRAHARK